MSQGQSEREKWMAAAEAREYARGNKPNDPDDVLPHVGLVEDAETRRLLNHLAECYDPTLSESLPARVEDTRLYQKILQRAATNTVSRAVNNGDVQTQSFLVGDPAAQSDVSGIKAISKLRDLVAEAAPLFYLFGAPGGGKTNFALLLAQLWKQERSGGVLVSNIRTWQEADVWVRNYGELKAVLDGNLKDLPEGGITQVEDAEDILIVFDEASSHASGRGEMGAEAGEKLAPLVYKVRKSRAGLVIVGHDGKDVHPAVRTLAYAVEKPRDRQKRATIYEDVRDRRGIGEILSLSGVPVTDYTYDDKEATSWSWDAEEGETETFGREEVEDLAADMVEEEVRRLAASMKESDRVPLTREEIGRALGVGYRGEPFTESWVDKWAGRYEREQEVSDGV